MLKFLPVVLIIIAAGGFLFVKLRPQPLATPTPTLLNETLPITKDSSVDERLKIIEDAITTLIKQVNSINNKQGPTSLDTKVPALQTTVSNLQNRINNLEKNNSTSQSTTQTTSTNKSPLYIPLGSGSSSNSEWANIDGTAISINPSDYPGYTSMQLETSLKVFQTGTAYARLYNKDDGTGQAEISTTSTSDTMVTSSTFTLPSSKKTYLLQLKGQISGYASTATNARIKVNF